MSDHRSKAASPPAPARHAGKIFVTTEDIFDAAASSPAPARHARTHGALTHQRQTKQKRRILSPKDTYQPRLTSERQRPATEPGGAVLEQAAAPLQRCGYARTDGAGAGVDIRSGEAGGARHRANGGGAVLGSEADLACRDLCAHMTRQRQSASVGLVGLFW